MTRTINKTDWTEFLKEYSSRNEGQPTRLGVFKTSDGVTEDLWIEDGLPLLALDVYLNKGTTRIDVLFENYTHSIDGVVRLVEVDGDRTDHGLDISDVDGSTTVMRFENWPLKSGD
jgi:hypothetical protein